MFIYIYIYYVQHPPMYSTKKNCTPSAYIARASMF